MKEIIVSIKNISRKKAFVFIESPFQLLCAYEAVNFFDVDYDLYVRLNRYELNNHQVKNIIEELGMNNVYYIDLPVKKDIFTKLKMLKFLIKNKLQNYDYYILGDYLSNLMKQFVKINSNDKIILLDDGVATYKIQRELKEIPLPLTLFSMFKIENFNNQKIYVNKFENLKKLYPTVDRSHDIFIGAQLVDLDILSLSVYIDIVKLAINNSKENKVIYFPHRRTSKEVLKELSAIENLEIAFPDTAIEFYLLKAGIKPKNIYSILSTALFSLSIIFEEANVIAYKPEFNKNEREEDIEKLYEMIAHDKNPINLISLDEDS